MSKRVHSHSRKMIAALGLCCGITAADAQNLAWARHLDGQGYDAAKTIAVDASGNTYISGYFSGVTDFDPGAGVQELTSSGWDVYLLKLNAAGEFEWVKHFEPVEDFPMAESAGIALDATGNIYLAGSFGASGAPSSIDFDPGPGVAELHYTENDYSTDIFVVKLDASGAFVWARKMGGDNNDVCNAMALDSEGNVLVTGSFKGTADFDPGAGTAAFTAVGPYGDGFVVKLDDDGNLVWAKSIGGNEQAIPRSIGVDAAGNVYTMGIFAGTVDFDPGTGTQPMTTVPGPYGWSTSNMFVWKLDAAGSYVWARQLGIPENLMSYSVNSFALSVDAPGNVYVTGGFTDTVDFDPGAGTAHLVSTLTGASDVDIFVCKLRHNGDFGWARSVGSIASDIAFAITNDEQGNVYTMGTFGGPADFDPSPATTFMLTPATSPGGLFVSKLDSTGSFVWASGISGPGNSIGINGEDIVFNPSDNSIHLASEFANTVDFDPGPDTFNMTAAQNNVFVLKLKNCNPFSATVTRSGNTLNTATTGSGYQWIDCDNGNTAIAGATGQSYTATVNGHYAVVVNKNDCIDTSDCVTIDGFTGMEEVFTHRNTLQLYPNPTNGQVMLKVQQAVHNGTVRVVNVLGQMIEERKNLDGTLFTCDLSRLPAGVYFVELQEGDTISRRKVVKE